jgi:hypothetical protein
MFVVDKTWAKFGFTPCGSAVSPLPSHISFKISTSMAHRKLWYKFRIDFVDMEWKRTNVCVALQSLCSASMQRSVKAVGVRLSREASSRRVELYPMQEVNRLIIDCAIDMVGNSECVL